MALQPSLLTTRRTGLAPDSPGVRPPRQLWFHGATSLGASWRFKRGAGGQLALTAPRPLSRMLRLAPPRR